MGLTISKFIHVHSNHLKILLRSLSYTCRQVNSVNTSLKTSSLAVICDLHQASGLAAGILKCYHYTETAYAYDKTTTMKQSEFNGKHTFSKHY